MNERLAPVADALTAGELTAFDPIAEESAEPRPDKGPLEGTFLLAEHPRALDMARTMTLAAALLLGFLVGFLLGFLAARK